MYAFCAICSGVMIRFLYPDYQERPLKIFDWSSGTIFPVSYTHLILLFQFAYRDILQIKIESQHTMFQIKCVVDTEVYLCKSRKTFFIIFRIVVICFTLCIPGRYQR